LPQHAEHGPRNVDGHLKQQSGSSCWQAKIIAFINLVKKTS
jgi:hypothetical protein